MMTLSKYLLSCLLLCCLASSLSAVTVRTRAIKNKAIFAITFPDDTKEYYGKEAAIHSISKQEYVTSGFRVVEINIVTAGNGLLRIYHSRALKLGELTGTEVGSYSNSYSFTDWQANSNQEQYTETVTFDGFEISLSGEFSDDDGNAINASLAANIDNYSETCTQASSYSFENGGDYSYECDLNETETDYAMVSLSIVFNLDISGVDDDVKVEFNASRTGLETGRGSLKLNYGGKQLNLNYEGGNTATLSNHNGVTMTLTETEVDEETSLSGDIKHGGTAFATISDDSGAVVIRYVDGSFETVM